MIIIKRTKFATVKNFRLRNIDTYKGLPNFFEKFLPGFLSFL